MNKAFAWTISIAALFITASQLGLLLIFILLPAPLQAANTLCLYLLLFLPFIWLTVKWHKSRPWVFASLLVPVAVTIFLPMLGASVGEAKMPSFRSDDTPLVSVPTPPFVQFASSFDLTPDSCQEPCQLLLSSPGVERVRITYAGRTKVRSIDLVMAQTTDCVSFGPYTIAAMRELVAGGRCPMLASASTEAPDATVSTANILEREPDRWFLTDLLAAPVMLLRGERVSISVPDHPVVVQTRIHYAAAATPLRLAPIGCSIICSGRSGIGRDVRVLNGFDDLELLRAAFSLPSPGKPLSSAELVLKVLDSQIAELSQPQEDLVRSWISGLTGYKARAITEEDEVMLGWITEDSRFSGKYVVPYIISLLRKYPYLVDRYFRKLLDVVDEAQTDAVEQWSYVMLLASDETVRTHREGIRRRIVSLPVETKSWLPALAGRVGYDVSNVLSSLDGDDLPRALTAACLADRESSPGLAQAALAAIRVAAEGRLEGQVVDALMRVAAAQGQIDAAIEAYEEAFPGMSTDRFRKQSYKDAPLHPEGCVRQWLR